jgi:hypothetical protein
MGEALMATVYERANMDWLRQKHRCLNCWSIITFVPEDIKDVEIEQYNVMAGKRYVLQFLGPCPVCEQSTTFRPLLEEQS